MENKSYPFASSVIKARELKLIPFDKLLRITESDNAREALNAILETGYGRGAEEIRNAYDFEALIAKELQDVYAFIKEISPDKRITDLFFLKYDYHNIKVMLKLMAGGEPLENGLYIDAGTLALKQLEEDLAEKHYESFHEPLKNALTAIDKQIGLNGDVSYIGFLLDKAYALDIISALETLGTPLLTQYFTGVFDFGNIIALLRLKAAGMEKEMLKQALLPGGSIPDATFYRAFEMDTLKIQDIFARGAYEKYLKKAFASFSETGRLYMFEKQRDDYLMDDVKKARHEMFNIAPVIGYLLAKEREASGIRMVMTAKLNRIENDVLFERLKELYV